MSGVLISDPTEQISMVIGDKKNIFPDRSFKNSQSDTKVYKQFYLICEWQSQKICVLLKSQ